MRVPECACSSRRLLFALVGHLLTIAAHKLLDATCGIDELLLACVKRVAERADVNVNDRTFDAVDDLCVIGLVRRYADPLVVAVYKKHGISLWMDSFFHVAACVRTDILAF